MIIRNRYEWSNMLMSNMLWNDLEISHDFIERFLGCFSLLEYGIVLVLLLKGPHSYHLCFKAGYIINTLIYSILFLFYKYFLVGK